MSSLRPLTSKMASSLVALRDIPTISALYRAKRLAPSSDDDDLPTPSKAFNNKICTIKADLTKLRVDAIVNAANSSLLGGGGVDGAIHRAAGPDLVKECRTLNGCKTGSAKITDAYDLPCKKVIHAVGPVYDSDKESEPFLRGCYRTSLKLAADNGCKSIAFSAISTGVYGYPSESAAEAAIDEAREFLDSSDGGKLDKVVFCNFLDKDVNAYSQLLPSVSKLPVLTMTNPIIDLRFHPRKRTCPKVSIIWKDPSRMINCQHLIRPARGQPLNRTTMPRSLLQAQKLRTQYWSPARLIT